MPLPVTFGNLSGSIALAGLDQNFTAVGVMGIMPCTVSGADVLALALNTNTPTVSAYANYMCFSGVAASDNTTAVTAQVGALGVLNVYKDSINGPVALVGGEIQAGAAIWLTYDSALNSGAGGFHLQTGSAILKGQTLNPSNLQIGTGATLTNVTSRLATLTYTVSAANSSQDVTATLNTAAFGDVVEVTPQSITPPAGAGYLGYMAATGTLNVRMLNATAATLAATTVILRLTALRFV